MYNFGNRLREEREKLDVNQKEFSIMMKITEVTQSNYENEKRIPDAAYLKKAAKAGIDVNYVVTGERCISEKKMLLIEELEKKLKEAMELLTSLKS